MLLQTISVGDWRFRDYRSARSWIANHIFPGAELASGVEILASLARVSRLSLHYAHQFGCTMRAPSTSGANGFTSARCGPGAGIRRAIRQDVGLVPWILRGGVSSNGISVTCSCC